MKNKTKYRCNKCGKEVKRDSNKKWINSYCTTYNDESRLYKIEPKSKKSKTQRHA